MWWGKEDWTEVWSIQEYGCHSDPAVSLSSPSITVIVCRFMEKPLFLLLLLRVDSRI